MNAKRVVIDASAALKWRLRDEEAIAQADAILEDFLAGRVDLLTPTLFDYEVANALRVAVTRKRLSEEDAYSALADFARFSITRHDFTGLATLAFELSGQYQRSAYDGAYLALGQSLGVWFYSGDKRLVNAVGQTLAWVKWVGDYQSEAVPPPGTEIRP